MKIQDKIRTIRTIKGLSQENIAAKLKKTPQAYSKIERGETALTLETLGDIAVAMNVNPFDITDYDGNQVFNNHAPHNAGGNVIFQHNEHTSDRVRELEQEIAALKNEWKQERERFLCIIEKMGNGKSKI